MSEDKTLYSDDDYFTLPDTKACRNIIKVLKQYRTQGIWIRKLSREAGVSPSTVLYYIKLLRQFLRIVESPPPMRVKLIYLEKIPPKPDNW